MDRNILELAKEAGFTYAVDLDPQKIKLMDDVRKMCEKNSCGMYGHNWACPPACGDLTECEAKVRRFHSGILVQTVGELEDAFDGEAMMETEAEHKKHFAAFHDILKPQYPNLLSLGAGCCTRCKKCTYPEAPCRFPDKRFSSMESFGMLVTQVCEESSLAYYHGPLTIAYTSCYLLE